MNEVRLIDANALKEAIKNRRTYLSYEDAKDVLDLIDNAPTIIWCSETPDGLPLMNLRPRLQGEWIYGEDDCGQDGWFCSECDFFVPWYYQYYEDIDFIRDYKVCPHCLAEMVTYTGKDRDKKGGAE